MAKNKKSKYQKPLRIETVRGEPYTIGERTLFPVMRIVSYGRARASIGTRRLEGWAAGLVRVTPLAMVEEMPGGDRRFAYGERRFANKTRRFANKERRIAIHDGTKTALGRILAMAVAVTLFCAAIRWVARQQRSDR